MVPTRTTLMQALLVSNERLSLLGDKAPTACQGALPANSAKYIRIGASIEFMQGYDSLVTDDSAGGVTTPTNDQFNKFSAGLNPAFNFISPINNVDGTVAMVAESMTLSYQVNIVRSSTDIILAATSPVPALSYINWSSDLFNLYGNTLAFHEALGAFVGFQLAGCTDVISADIYKEMCGESEGPCTHPSY